MREAGILFCRSLQLLAALCFLIVAGSFSSCVNWVSPCDGATASAIMKLYDDTKQALRDAATTSYLYSTKDSPPAPCSIGRL
jgi:hypothetical protein